MNVNKNLKKGDSFIKAMSPSIQTLFPNEYVGAQTASTTALIHYAQLYGGKLLLESELDLSPQLLHYFIQQDYMRKIPSMKRDFFGRFICVRCNNKNKEFFQLTPCFKCGKQHHYCRHCVQLGKVMECNALYAWTGPRYEWKKHDAPLTWSGTLTTEQRAVSEKMLQAIEKRQSILIWAVTGSGKTEMLFPAITDGLRKGKRICVATPRADVVRELLPRFQQAFSTATIQGLYGGSRDNDGTAQIIIATTHQLMRFQHAFDTLIIDEVDAFPYHNDKSLHFAAKRSAKYNNHVIYLTATPRNNQLTKIYTKQLDFVFVPLRFHHHLIPVPKLQYCKHLSKTVQINKMPKQLEIWIKNRKRKDRQLLLFVPTITYAEAIEVEVGNMLMENGFITHVKQITSVTSEDDDREEKIVAFRQKDIYCMLTTTILERGVTFPSVDVAVILANHAVFDEQALIQITGRVGRSKLDPTGEVIFFHDGKTNGITGALRTINWMNEEASKQLVAYDEELKNE